jgi:site-specific DNA recombinase
MAVAIYLRVSTEEQRERQSIETQREFASRYCDLHKLTVDKIYADDGISGTVPLERRPEGCRIIEDAKRGRFDQLLIFKLDRLGRETRLILNAVDELEKLGVRVRSMTEEFDTASATGRLMLTMLSGFASHEHAVIRERSMAGARRLAESGAWMGGIVPYGYRKHGDKKNARLIPAEDSIPGSEMSEVDVIKRIYRMSAIEGKSCRVIAQRLNQMKIPCAYVRDDRLLLRGKRKQRTSGVWRGGRVRNLIASTTYKGVHEYGKRTRRRDKPLITRAVPPLVNEKTWNKAQETLKRNFLFAPRNGKKRQYLLRGLIKCGICGLSYSGKTGGSDEVYYRCNGYQHGRGHFGRSGERCPSKGVRCDHLENQIWSDVQRFLLNPGPILGEIQSRLQGEQDKRPDVSVRLKRLEALLAEKAEERTRVVSLFRRGRIDEHALDDQMAEIGAEEASLREQIEQLRPQGMDAEAIRTTIISAEALLSELRTRLDRPVSWELKRELIEILVASIRVETIDDHGIDQTRITVTYRFKDSGDGVPALLSQQYFSGPQQIAIQPQTVGDHLRLRRLRLKLRQRDVAKKLGVKASSVWNWENNCAKPELRWMPVIIEFLGYNPLPEATTLAEQLIRARFSRGLNQKEAAKQMGVDPSTLARWERGEHTPTGKHEPGVQEFLAE